MSSDKVDVLILGGGIVGLWTARRARELGLSVCVLEVGGRSLDAARNVHPALHFPERENLGATRARHQVLTGNSAFWGGGLADNRLSSLARVCGVTCDDPLLPRIQAHAFDVKRTLGVCDVHEEWTEDWPEAEGLFPQEVTALPGKRRGLWSQYLEPTAGHRHRVDIRTDARVVDAEFGEDGAITAVTYKSGDVHSVVRASTVVLSMGVLDTNLFALQHLRRRSTPARARRLATMLHDHWSVPILDIQWKNGRAARRLFPPRFTSSGIVGRRLGFEGGFFHLVADYDHMPPYDRVKRLLAARQRGASAMTSLALSAATLGRPLKMLAAGVHYLTHRELLIPDGATVRLVCDFESAASESNRVTVEDERALLGWDVREQDLTRFLEIRRTHGERLERLLASCDLQHNWRWTDTNEAAASSYFRANAIDAYHLGGGLAGVASAPNERISSETGRLFDFPNVYVMSTASFFAPGDANPVLTLLARVGAMFDEVTRRPIEVQ